jgi:ubiquinone/menaquinone biosynthesis C-methylase UbiE
VTKSAAQRFSDTAAGYAATMAPSVRRMALEVVRRAALAPGERVLDIGTGTGTAAAAARGDGREVIGVDAAPGMLEIARREVEGVEFLDMEMAALAFGDAVFDAVLAAHVLLFADDQGAALAEWLRVTRPGGRLSLSVPGPEEATSKPIYGAIYERYGVGLARRYPTAASLEALVAEAGWREVRVEADPSTAVLLADEEQFRLWRNIGTQGATASELTPEQHAALTDEMLAVTQRTEDGGFRIPFGTLYATAVR